MAEVKKDEFNFDSQFQQFPDLPPVPEGRKGVSNEQLIKLKDFFPPSKLKHRQGSKVGTGVKALAYLKSSAYSDRLDEVVGAGNWVVQYAPACGQLFCRISILIEGYWVGRVGMGSPSNVSPAKGQTSDAFKRAATAWGIANYISAEELNPIVQLVNGRFPNAVPIPKKFNPEMPEGRENNPSYIYAKKAAERKKKAEERARLEAAEKEKLANPSNELSNTSAQPSKSDSNPPKSETPASANLEANKKADLSGLSESDFEFSKKELNNDSFDFSKKEISKSDDSSEVVDVYTPDVLSAFESPNSANQPLRLSIIKKYISEKYPAEFAKLGTSDKYWAVLAKINKSKADAGLSHIEKNSEREFSQDGISFAKVYVDLVKQDKVPYLN